MAENRKIGLILFLAALVRLWGIGFGLPQRLHIDEVAVVHYSFRFITGDFNPYPFFDYPSIHLYLLYIFYFIFFVFGFLTSQFRSLDNFAGFFFSYPTPFYLLGRLLTVALSVMTIFLVYRLGKKFSPRAALLSSFFLAFLPGHILHSHYTTVDVSSAFFIFLAFYFIYQYWERGDKKTLLFAGILCGVAAGIKYNGGLIFFSLVAAAILRKEKISTIILSIFIGVTTFFLTSPYILLDFKNFSSGIYAQYLTHISWGKGFPKGWISYPLVVGEWAGWLIFCLALLGGLAAIFRREKKMYLIISFPLIYWIFMGSWKGAGSQHAVSFYPFLVILAAWFVDFVIENILFVSFPSPCVIPAKAGIQGDKLQRESIVKSIKTGFVPECSPIGVEDKLNRGLRHSGMTKLGVKVCVLGGIVGMFLISVLPKIINIDYSLWQKDTKVLAHDWVIKNIPPRTKILRFGYTPEFYGDPFNVELDWYGKKKNLPFSELKNNFDYLITSGGNTQPEEFKKNLESNAQLIGEFRKPSIGGIHNPIIQVWKIKK